MLASLLAFQADPLGLARRHAERGELAAAIEVLESSTEELRSPAAYAFLSDLQARTNRLPQAARSLSRALELAPQQHRWRTTLGALLFQLGRMEEARLELQRVVDQWPEGALAHYYLANILKAEGELPLAESHAERAVELLPMSSARWPLDRLEHPPPVNALVLLADIRDARGADSEELVVRALRAEPLHAPARYLHARILQDRGRMDEAAAELQQFRKIRRAEQHVMNALSLAFNGASRRPDRILDELEKAVEALPEHHVALYLTGRELLRQERRVEAASFFERCARLRPGPMAQEVRRLSATGAVLEAMEILDVTSRALSSAPGYSFLSQLQAQTNRLPQAARSLKLALEIDPSQHRWRATLGSLLFQLGRIEEARVELSKVVEEWPDAALAHYYLGTILETERELARAEEHARRAVELLPLSSSRWALDRLDHPLPVNALFLLANVVAAQGRDSGELLQQVLSVEPVHAPARYLSARLLQDRGDDAGANEELSRFHAIKKAEAHVRNALTYLFSYETRDTEKPLAELRQAVAAMPDHPSALFLLARELVRSGRADEAREYLDRLARLRPEARDQWEPLLQAVDARVPSIR